VRFPVVTVALILINVVMFFGFQKAHWDGRGFAVNPSNTVHYAFIPYKLTHLGKPCGQVAIVEPSGERVGDKTSEEPQCQGKVETLQTTTGEQVRQRVARVVDKTKPSVWLTILTAMFMHGGLLHIGGNMLFLWIFGNNVEDSMGRGTFVAFYLLGGLAATLLQTVLGSNSTIPNLGASGAIAAVLGGYALLYPRARVVTLIFIIFFITVLELPALLVLGGWFVLQVLSAGSQVGAHASGGVAYGAHIGGFLFGLLAIKLFARRAKDHYVEPRLPVY